MDYFLVFHSIFWLLLGCSLAWLGSAWLGLAWLSSAWLSSAQLGFDFEWSLKPIFGELLFKSFWNFFNVERAKLLQNVEKIIKHAKNLPKKWRKFLHNTHFSAISGYPRISFRNPIHSTDFGLQKPYLANILLIHDIWKNGLLKFSKKKSFFHIYTDFRILLLLHSTHVIVKEGVNWTLNSY